MSLRDSLRRQTVTSSAIAIVLAGVGGSVGCDPAPNDASSGGTAAETGGGAHGAPIPKGDFKLKADDYQVATLINEAEAAINQGSFALAQEKLSAAEKLKDVSEGTDTQIAEVRSRLEKVAAGARGSATNPTTQPDAR